MGTEIETSLPRHCLKRFWGGDANGVCFQITCQDSFPDPNTEEVYIVLTMEEASELINHLADFVRDEAVRRQGLLKQQIESIKEAEKTVFHEVANLDPSIFNVPRVAVELISKFCPKRISQIETKEEA